MNTEPHIVVQVRLGTAWKTVHRYDGEDPSKAHAVAKQAVAEVQSDEVRILLGRYDAAKGKHGYKQLYTSGPISQSAPSQVGPLSEPEITPAPSTRRTMEGFAGRTAPPPLPVPAWVPPPLPSASAVSSAWSPPPLPTGATGTLPSAAPTSPLPHTQSVIAASPPPPPLPSQHPVEYVVQVSVDNGVNWQATKLYHEPAAAKEFARQIRQRVAEYAIRIVGSYYDGPSKRFQVLWIIERDGSAASPKEKLIENVSQEINIVRLSPLYLYVVNVMTLGSVAMYWLFKRRHIFNMMAGRDVFHAAGFYAMAIGWSISSGVVFLGITTHAIWFGSFGFFIGLIMMLIGRIFVVPKLRICLKQYSRHVLGVEQHFSFIPSAFGGVSYLAHKLNGLVVAK